FPQCPLFGTEASMFEQALLESSTNPQRPRRAVSTVISVAVQMALLGVAILAPILAPVLLPTARSQMLLFAPPQLHSDPEPTVRTTGARSGSVSVVSSSVLQMPGIVSRAIGNRSDTVADAAPTWAPDSRGDGTGPAIFDHATPIAPPSP